jgi:hypothetical protein
VRAAQFLFLELLNSSIESWIRQCISVIFKRACWSPQNFREQRMSAFFLCVDHFSFLIITSQSS